MYIRINENATKMATVRKIAVDWNSVGRRIREYRGVFVKQAAFARDLGISQGQLSRYEKGISEVGAEILLRLAKKSGKSIEWWLTGE